MSDIIFCIVTVSDTCSKGLNVDRSGPILKDLIHESISNSVVVGECVVPDDVDEIKRILIEWSDKPECHVIFTTGGTGIAPRDVTPEATQAVIEKQIPGISQAMMNKSLSVTPFAMLSRAVCGIRNKTLIVNFPGSAKAVVENFEVIKGIIPHAVALIKDNKSQVDLDHACGRWSSSSSSPSKVTISAVARRDRVSKYKMLSVEDALSTIYSNCPATCETEALDINTALGRVLAEDIIAVDPLPPFRASIKDGYAVKSTDGSGARFVCDAKVAGDNPNAAVLQNGQCVRISTGAPVPPGADAVVQVEDTELLEASSDGTKELKIMITSTPSLGQDIREIGSDIAAGTIVVLKKSVLNAAEIGVLAAVGKTNVQVYKRPKIAVISTGNELQDPGVPLQYGRVRDSNKTTLINFLKQYSYSSQDFGIAKDDPNHVKQIFENAFKTCDFVITTGGVSMGECDVMKPVLVQDFSATIHFGRVDLKPGKPTTFATCLYEGKKKVVFALPGNPVSATVTCFQFVIPALRFLENSTSFPYPAIPVQHIGKLIGDKFRPELQRVTFGEQEVDDKNSGNSVTVSTTGNQISSRLNSCVGAHGLMLIEPGKFEEPSYKCYILNRY